MASRPCHRLSVVAGSPDPATVSTEGLLLWPGLPTLPPSRPKVYAKLSRTSPPRRRPWCLDRLWALRHAPPRPKRTLTRKRRPAVGQEGHGPETVPQRGMFLLPSA